MIKQWRQRISKIQMKRGIMFAIILVCICILGATSGQILMKLGINQLDSIKDIKQLFNIVTLFKIFTSPYIIAGLLCYAIPGILWLGAMSTLNISFMYPLLSLGYLTTALAASIFLKEGITPIHWIGIFLIVVGCSLVASTKL